MSLEQVALSVGDRSALEGSRPQLNYVLARKQ